MRAIVTFCLAFAIVATGSTMAFAQTSEQGEMQQVLSGGPDVPNEAASADRIIQVLQRDPMLMEEVKTLGAEQARARGLAVDESQISDSTLFTNIREDADLRLILTRYLVQKGALDNTDTDVPVLSTRTEGSSRNQTTLQNRRSSNRRVQERIEQIPQSTPPESGPKANSVPSPYSKVPALDDLYKQYRKDDAPLRRFGASLFASTNSQTASNAIDLPGGDDYVLGPGDGLTLTLSGGASQTLRRDVDREGRVTLPEVGAVAVAGKTLHDAQQFIQNAVATQFKNTKVDISLTRVRSLRVYVVGDVTRPGAYDISSLSTPLNALIAAGGPTSRGSLRLIKHYRGSKLITEVDLYEFMLKGIRSDVERLHAGDTLLVPPAGPEVRVRGMVKRPAIYELRTEKTLADVLDLAGGVLVSGALGQVDVQRIEAHEKRTMISVRTPANAAHAPSNDSLAHFQVQDGDEVTIAPILPYSEDVVYLDGHVVRPGKFAFQKGMKLTDLLSSYEVLLPEPAERGEIIRLLPPDLRPTTIEFNVGHAVAGDEPILLQPFDTIRIFGRYEMDAPKIAIYGEVMRPGEYPLTPGMTAASVVRLSGGFKRSAQTQTAELSTYQIESDKVSVEHRTIDIGKALAGDTSADVTLKAGDVVSIHQINGWNEIGASVTVSGEIGNPGTYGIAQGEKLSSLIRRAGSFRTTAYPAGAVFERQQVKELDDRSRVALIHRIESAQPNVKSPEGAILTTAFVQQQQTMLQRLKSQQPNGRLVIKITGDVSKWENTPADIELRAGDTLFIPKKPSFVLVNGQVNNPSAVTFIPGKDASWYLRRSGGVTDYGNTKSIFVIRADGTVVGRNGASSWFSGNVLSTVMQAGDTIVVPEKIITESTFWKNVLNTVQITSSLAIAARVATSF